MSTYEGVRKATNRMELVQKLRAKLVKTRLTLIVVVGLLAVSGAMNIALLNNIKEQKEVVVVKETKIKELSSTVSELEVDKNKLEEEVIELSSFDALMDKLANVEDLALEAAHNAKAKESGYVSYDLNGKLRKTDILFTDYIVDTQTGERIRTFENNNEMFVVYIDSKVTEVSLNNALGKEYYYGTEDYYKATNTNGVVVIRHDIKEV